MRNFFLAAVTVAFVSTVSPVRAEDTKVSVGKINAVLTSILEEVMKANNGELGSFFTKASFKVDEAGTDFSSNDFIKAKISSRATATGAAWAGNQDTTLQLDVTFAADRKKQTASGTLGMKLDTDTLAMFRFAADKVTPSWCTPREGGPEQDPTGKAVCEQVKAIANAADITAVFASFGRISKLYVVDAQERVTAAEKDLANATGEDKTWLERRLKSAQDSLKFAVVLQTFLWQSYQKGKDTGAFSVKIFDLPIYASTEVPELELYLDKGKFEIDVRVIQKNIKDIDSYFAQKAKFEKDLLKLQNQDPETVKSAQSTIQFFLEITKEIIGKPQF